MGFDNSQKAWLLSPNRVERFFIGGQKLDEWQRLSPAASHGDSTFSEELLVNTNPYIGPGTPPLEGLSLVEDGGRTLRSLIEEDPVGFLGKELSTAYGSECSVLCKAGDSTGRLILQYHPTQAFSRRYLSCAFGKTEAWYMLASREGSSQECYVGFQPGVTREAFEALVSTDDVEGMLRCIHRVRFQLGDVVLVPAGMIHAMGPDTTFVEVHEPCDYTMRFERDNYGRRMEDYDLHYGLGFQTLFDGLDFTPYTEAEIRQRVLFHPQPVAEGDGWQLSSLLPPAACAEFSMEKLLLQKEYLLPEADAFVLLVALHGDVHTGGLRIPQGRAAFVPAAATSCSLSAQDAEVLLVRPGKPQPNV